MTTGDQMLLSICDAITQLSTKVDRLHDGIRHNMSTAQCARFDAYMASTSDHTGLHADIGDHDSSDG